MEDLVTSFPSSAKLGFFLGLSSQCSIRTIADGPDWPQGQRCSSVLWLESTEISWVAHSRFCILKVAHDVLWVGHPWARKSKGNPGGHGWEGQEPGLACRWGICIPGEELVAGHSCYRRLLMQEAIVTALLSMLLCFTRGGYNTRAL